jgi:hypothetical protein
LGRSTPSQDCHIVLAADYPFSQFTTWEGIAIDAEGNIAYMVGYFWVDLRP